MKIRITSDWYQPVVNGVVTSVTNLTDSLRAMGHEVRILTLSNTLHAFRRGEVSFLGSVGVGLIYPQARPLPAGDGPRRRKLKDVAAAPALAGHVIFTGMVPPEHIAAVYRRCLAAAEGSAA